MSLALADEVQAPVDAVRAVDVRVAGRPEHRRVALACGPGNRARRDPLRRRPRPPRSARRRRHEQGDADELRRDLVDAAREERRARGNRTRRAASLGRPVRRLEQLARAAAEIGEVDTAGGASSASRSASESASSSSGDPRRVVAHVVQDRPLGARGDDRIGDALDPDESALAAAAVVAGDRLERVDPVRARVLAEAEEDHARAVHAVSIQQRRAELGQLAAERSATRSWSSASSAA